MAKIPAHDADGVILDQDELDLYLNPQPTKASNLDAHGREIPDPTPMAPPVGYNRQPSLSEQIRAMVRSERLAQEVAAAGYETFEEADDFDVGDDFEPSSPYEGNFDPIPAADRDILMGRSPPPESPPASLTEPPAPPAPVPPSDGPKAS